MLIKKKKKKTRGIERYCNNNTIRDDKASTCRCKQFWHEDRNCHVKQEWFTCALFYVFNFSCLAYLFRIMIKINKRARKKLTVSQPLILILEKIDYDFRTIFLVPFLLHSLFLRQKKKKKSMAVKSFIRRSSARNLTRSVKKLAIPIVGETKL